MPERILKAVALPSTLFWAPQTPAFANMGLHALLMIYGWAFAKLSPLTFIISFLVMHIFIASQGAREPHLTTVLQAWAVSRKRTRNLHPGKTRKYVP
jgi:hypothetical protein